MAEQDEAGSAETLPPFPPPPPPQPAASRASAAAAASNAASESLLLTPSSSVAPLGLGARTGRARRAGSIGPSPGPFQARGAATVPFPAEVAELADAPD